MQNKFDDKKIRSHTLTLPIQCVSEFVSCVCFCNGNARNVKICVLCQHSGNK